MTVHRILGPTRTEGLALDDKYGWENEAQGYWVGLPIGGVDLAWHITSGFLEWEQFRKNMGLGRHGGVDVAAPEGTWLGAMADGKVVFATNENDPAPSGCGRQVRILHAYGIVTQICHLSKVDVDRGDFVLRGMKIGEVGNTGASTGPHAHIVVRDPFNDAEFNWTTNNPLAYISDDEDELAFGNIEHTVQVQAGDTLAQIVAEFNEEFDFDLRVSEVAEFSGIANMNKIDVGQIIFFPRGEKLPDTEYEEDDNNMGSFNEGRLAAAQDVLTALGLGDVLVITGHSDGPTDDEGDAPDPEPQPTPEPIVTPDVGDVILQFRRGSAFKNMARVEDIESMLAFGGIGVMFCVANLETLLAGDFEVNDTIEVSIRGEHGGFLSKPLPRKADSQGLVKIGTLVFPRTIGETGIGVLQVSVSGRRGIEWFTDHYEIPFNVTDQSDARFNLDATPASEQMSVYVNPA